MHLYLFPQLIILLSNNYVEVYSKSFISHLLRYQMQLYSSHTILHLKQQRFIREYFYNPNHSAFVDGENINFVNQTHDFGSLIP